MCACVRVVHGNNERQTFRIRKAIGIDGTTRAKGEPRFAFCGVVYLLKTNSIDRNWTNEWCLMLADERHIII